MIKNNYYLENASACFFMGSALSCGNTLYDTFQVLDQELSGSHLINYKKLISLCEINSGHIPQDEILSDNIPEVIVLLISIGWCTGTLDKTYLTAASWFRSNSCYGENSDFVQNMTQAIKVDLTVLDESQIGTSTAPFNLQELEKKLQADHPISSTQKAEQFSRIAGLIEQGSDPLTLVKEEELTALELLFFRTGLNAGILDLSLRKLAACIDYRNMVSSKLISS